MASPEKGVAFSLGKFNQLRTTELTRRKCVPMSLYSISRRNKFSPALKRRSSTVRRLCGPQTLRAHLHLAFPRKRAQQLYVAQKKYLNREKSCADAFLRVLAKNRRELFSAYDAVPPQISLATGQIVQRASSSSVTRDAYPIIKRFNAPIDLIAE